MAAGHSGIGCGTSCRRVPAPYLCHQQQRRGISRLGAGAEGSGSGQDSGRLARSIQAFWRSRAGRRLHHCEPRSRSLHTAIWNRSFAGTAIAGLPETVPGKRGRSEGSPLMVDCLMPLGSVAEDRYWALRALAPFGVGFPEPVFISTGLKISRCLAKWSGRAQSPPYVGRRHYQGKLSLVTARCPVRFGTGEIAAALTGRCRLHDGRIPSS